MHPDLERVVSLQRLDLAVLDAQRRLAEEPERERSFEARLQAARERLASANERLAANQRTRRAIEKDAAVQQSRLSKFRDQLMEVKTNREYQAMQHEIEIAQKAITVLEERILEQMLEGDDLAAAVAHAEADLAAEQTTVEADRLAMKREHAVLRASLEPMAEERAALIGSIDKAVLDLFELVARRRNGIAVAEARDGVCTVCHVRLRPQVFNDVRRNDGIIQCDSCQRILYFSTEPAAAAQ